MKHVFAASFGLLLLTLVACSSASEQVAPLPSEAGSSSSVSVAAQASTSGTGTVMVRAGETFTIGVEANGSIGWNWVPTMDDAYLALQSQDCVSSTQPMPGSSCTQQLVFLAKQPGETTLTVTRWFRGQVEEGGPVQVYHVTIR